VSEQEKQLNVRIDSRLYDRLEEYVSQHNVSKKQAIEEAIKLLVHEKEKEEAGLKQIITKYAGKCSKCGRDIQVGEIAFWGKGVLLCYDCFMQQNAQFATQEGKAIYRYYKQLRKLRALIAESKNELEALQSRIDIYETHEKIYEILYKIDSTLETLKEYMFRVENTPDLQKVLQDIERIKEQVEEFLAVFKLRKKARIELEEAQA